MILFGFWVFFLSPIPLLLNIFFINIWYWWTNNICTFLPLTFIHKDRSYKIYAVVVSYYSKSKELRKPFFWWYQNHQKSFKNPFYSAILTDVLLFAFLYSWLPSSHSAHFFLATDLLFFSQLSKYPASPYYPSNGTVEVVREAGHSHPMTLTRLLTSDPQVWSSTSCWWVTRPSGTRTSTACTPRSRRGPMITPAQSGTLSPLRSWPLLMASSYVSRDDNSVLIPGQEPD